MNTDCNWLFLSLSAPPSMQSLTTAAWTVVDYIITCRLALKRVLYAILQCRLGLPFVHGACTATSPPFRWCLVPAPPEYLRAGRPTPLDCLLCYHRLRWHRSSVGKKKREKKWNCYCSESEWINCGRLWNRVICGHIKVHNNNNWGQSWFHSRRHGSGKGDLSVDMDTYNVVIYAASFMFVCL